jgi:hypothetical protein
MKLVYLHPWCMEQEEVEWREEARFQAWTLPHTREPINFNFPWVKQVAR